jgi:Trk K+ transport system NAD-binding subunit/Kef-type K+ transport system membrane component KefB
MVSTFLVVASFALLVLAAKDIGKGSRWLGLPMISGFLLTGVLAGPYVLGIVTVEGIRQLRIIDSFALAFIAFAAGGELDLAALRNHLRQIIAIIAAQTVVVFSVGMAAFLLLADQIPFMRALSGPERLAVAILGASIMVARSPSSAYAVIKELRARGPFTHTVLGVTVLMDVVVIMTFAFNASVADVLVGGASFNASILMLLIFEIALDIGMGVLVGQLLRALLARRLDGRIKSGLVLLTGYGIFFVSGLLHEVHLGVLPVGIFSEPLLVGLVAGFFVANYTRYATEFRRVVESTAPGVFIVFFTLVGASLQLDLLAQTWAVALLLLLVRLVGLSVGTLIGSTAAGNPLRESAIMGMTFVTQAGISVGLARKVGDAFVPWGADLATLSIAVIVAGQAIGPPLFKWALHLAGEAHPRAETPGFDGVRDAIIFGADDDAVALARKLGGSGWHVKLAGIDAARMQRIGESGLETHLLSLLSPAALHALRADHAEAIVALLDDETNYQVCELAYEHFGTATIVVRLNDRADRERFRALGVLIVEPETANVTLLHHFVRSPFAASLLLGQEAQQGVVEVVVGNRDLHGIALRDLRLPLGTLILSVRRRDRLLLAHGYTRLELGDEVALVGEPESLDEVQWRFEA